jgi:hypothetical protein
MIPIFNPPDFDENEMPDTIHPVPDFAIVRTGPLPANARLLEKPSSCSKPVPSALLGERQEERVNRRVKMRVGGEDR